MVLDAFIELGPLRKFAVSYCVAGYITFGWCRCKMLLSGIFVLLRVALNEGMGSRAMQRGLGPQNSEKTIRVPYVGNIYSKICAEKEASVVGLRYIIRCKRLLSLRRLYVPKAGLFRNKLSTLRIQMEVMLVEQYKIWIPTIQITRGS